MKNACPENFHKILRKGRPRNSSLLAFEIIAFQLYEKKKDYAWGVFRRTFQNN